MYYQNPLLHTQMALIVLAITPHNCPPSFRHASLQFPLDPGSSHWFHYHSDHVTVLLETYSLPISLRLKLSLGSQFSPLHLSSYSSPLLLWAQVTWAVLLFCKRRRPTQSCLSSLFFPLLGMMFCRLLNRYCHNIFKQLIRWHLLSEA